MSSIFDHSFSIMVAAANGGSEYFRSIVGHLVRFHTNIAFQSEFFNVFIFNNKSIGYFEQATEIKINSFVKSRITWRGRKNNSTQFFRIARGIPENAQRLHFDSFDIFRNF